jgi:hypothetical protein
MTSAWPTRHPLPCRQRAGCDRIWAFSRSRSRRWRPHADQAARRRGTHAGAAKSEPGAPPASAADRACQEECQALQPRQRPDPVVEGRYPRSGERTLLDPAPFPGALHLLVTDGLIGINSRDVQKPLCYASSRHCVSLSGQRDSPRRHSSLSRTGRHATRQAFVGVVKAQQPADGLSLTSCSSHCLTAGLPCASRSACVVSDRRCTEPIPYHSACSRRDVLATLYVSKPCAPPWADMRLSGGPTQLVA